MDTFQALLGIVLFDNAESGTKTQKISPNL